MAEEFVEKLRIALSKGEAVIWGEIPRLLTGAVTFRRWTSTSPPSSVYDVYVVVGGAFSSDAHYQVVPSDSHKGRYEYVHRLSLYRLNSLTFRRVVEQVIDKVLQTLDGDGEVATVLTIQADDSLELVCCTNGHQNPDWTVRILPAIFGAGSHPVIEGRRTADYEEGNGDPRWLLLPPMRNQRHLQHTWEITCQPAALEVINALPVLQRALLCTAYEAEVGEWEETKNLDVPRLLTSVAPTLTHRELRPSLALQTKTLLEDFKVRLDRRDLPDYLQPQCNLLADVNEVQVSNLALRIEQMLKSEDFESRVDQLDSSINQNHLPSPYQNGDFSTIEEETPPDPVEEEMVKLFSDLSDFKSPSPLPPPAPQEIKKPSKKKPKKDKEEEETQKSNATSSSSTTKVASSSSSSLPNGNFKPSYHNGDLPKGSSSDEPRSRNQFVAILAIGLVIFVVALVFAVAFLEGRDVIKLMEIQLTKFADFSPDDKHEL